MRNRMNIIALALICLPALVSAQECILTGSPVWTLPQKGELDAPAGGAIFIGAPLGNGVTIELGSFLTPVNQETYSQSIFSGSGLAGEVSGFIELTGSGSTSKKTPYKYTVGTREALSNPTIGEPTGITKSVVAEDASECGALLTSLYCGAGEKGYQLTVSMDDAPRAWAVRDVDTSEWILLPGECAPAARFAAEPVDSTCIEFIAFDERGGASGPVVTCLGDTFEPSVESALESTEEAAGCATKNSPETGLLFVILFGLLSARRNAHEAL